MPELRLWSRRVLWDVVGRRPFDANEMHSLKLTLSHGEAFAAASDDPALLEGMHADSVLLLMDEAKSIVPATWEAVEGALSGTGEALALAVSTPGPPSGTFHAIHTRKPGLEDWWVRHVTLDEAVAAGRISPEWAEQRARQWGVASAVYQNRVLGEFHASDEDSCIPLAWIELATERWREWDDAGRPQGDAPAVLGVDVARAGGDKTVIATRVGDVVESLDRHDVPDLMAVTGFTAAKLGGDATAVIDCVGLGAGVLDRLREQKKNVVGFNASARSTARDRSGELSFLNQRSESWWRMREALDPSNDARLCLPPDDGLVGDLCAPRWKVNSTGKIQIESKDDLRRRIGRSTDAADAVIMSLGPSRARPRRKRRMTVLSRTENRARALRIAELAGPP